MRQFLYALKYGLSPERFAREYCCRSLHICNSHLACGCVNVLVHQVCDYCADLCVIVCLQGSDVHKPATVVSPTKYYVFPVGHAFRLNTLHSTTKNSCCTWACGVQRDSYILINAECIIIRSGCVVKPCLEACAGKILLPEAGVHANALQKACGVVVGHSSDGDCTV